MLTRSDEPLENGGNLPIRPDGGVVTQRTANPLSMAEKRESLQFSPFVHGIMNQGVMPMSANRWNLDAPERGKEG